MTPVAKCSALFAVLASALYALTLMAPGSQADQQLDGFALAVGDDGAIHLPDIDYRSQWVALGTWAVASDDDTMGAQGFHMVYSQPKAVEAFQRDGVFPDGTVLVKELFGTVTEDMTTGTVSRAAGTVGWFVMIKDSTGRYPDSKLWGEGWGWAYFDVQDPSTTTTTDYEADCLGCHIPAQDQDWVYTQGYPVLHQN